MILVDSHVLLWLLSGRGRLGPRAGELVRGAEGVYVSAISILELTIKSMLGKVTIPDDFVERVGREGFRSLAVTDRHAAGIRGFPEIADHDPFDRVLVAQAHDAGMRLLTADGVLLGLRRRFIVDATA